MATRELWKMRYGDRGRAATKADAGTFSALAKRVANNARRGTALGGERPLSQAVHRLS